MVTKPRTKTPPPWVASFLKRYRPPTAAELKRRQRALKRALELRERLDIRPLTTEELIRSLRDEA
jgi:hypothetical protein